MPDKRGFYTALETRCFTAPPCVACGGPTEPRWTHVSAAAWDGWLLAGLLCLRTATWEAEHVGGLPKPDTVGSEGRGTSGAEWSYRAGARSEP